MRAEAAAMIQGGTEGMKALICEGFRVCYAAEEKAAREPKGADDMIAGTNAHDAEIKRL